MLDLARAFAHCLPLLQVERTGLCVCVHDRTALVADPVGGLHPWFRFHADPVRGDLTVTHVARPPAPTRLHTVVDLDDVRPGARCAPLPRRRYECWNASGALVMHLHPSDARRCNAYRVDLYE